MTADTTPRNGSPRPELSRKARGPAPTAKIVRDEPGQAGLNYEPSRAEGSLTQRRPWQAAVDRVVEWVTDRVHRPRLFVRQPPSWDEVSAYGQNNALVRHPWLKRALLVWTYTVGFYTYWSAAIRMEVRARPLRALVCYGLTLILTWHTTPGRFIGHHVEVVGVFLITHLLP